MTIKEELLKSTHALDEAFCKGNLEALDSIYTPEAIIHVPPFTDIVGLDAIKQNVRQQHAQLTNIQVEQEEILCEGQTVVQRYILTAQNKANGKKSVSKRALFLHFKNGKVTEEFIYCDWSGAAK